MSMKVGDKCKCGHTLERKQNMFYWRGEYFDGAVCEPCNALYSIDGEEMPPLRPQPKHPSQMENE